MKQLIFSTGNSAKFMTAREVCRLYDINLSQNELEIDEIQGEDGALIAADKANKAYELIKEPVIVTDDSWSISALGGFPGAYMKSINRWFTVDDFLRLMNGIEDRRVFLEICISYKDGVQQKAFTSKYKGTILLQPKGELGPPFVRIVSMEGDKGLTISELYNNKDAQHDRELTAVWHEFAGWYDNTVN